MQDTVELSTITRGMDFKLIAKLWINTLQRQKRKLK